MFPVNNFQVRFLFEFLILCQFITFWKFSENIETKYAWVIFLTFLVLLLIDLFRSVYIGSLYELFDQIRYLTILNAFIVARAMSTIKQLYFAIYLIILLNFFVVVWSLNYGEIIFLRDFFYSRGFSESYSRHSGIFTNVAIMGIFSGLTLLLSLLKLRVSRLTRVRKLSLHIFFGVISAIALVLSGSKTAIVALLIVYILSIFHRLIIKGMSFKYNFILQISVIVISILIFQESLFTNYQIIRLGNLFTYGPSSISSFNVRTELWLDLLMIWKSDVFTLIFGLSKSGIRVITSTFDSDILWLISRYGFFGISIFFVITIKIIHFFIKNIQSPNVKMYILLYLWICSFALGILTTPPLLFVSTIILLRPSQ